MVKVLNTRLFVLKSYIVLHCVKHFPAVHSYLTIAIFPACKLTMPILSCCQVAMSGFQSIIIIVHVLCIASKIMM